MPIALPEMEVEAPPALPPRNVPPRLPGPKEIATLEVGGEFFTNWTSVRVEIKTVDWYPTFMFECTEESPMGLLISDMQFKPGEIVKVLLGGAPAIFGYITERHVGYNSTSHGVRLVGVGKTADITSSSVPVDKTGNHDNKSWMKLAQDLVAHLGIKVVPFGEVDNEPYENIQVMPGDKLQDVLERYAKPRHIMIGSDSNGNLKAVGEHPADPKGELVEDYHILRANCVWRDLGTFKQIDVVGQGFSGDGASGAGQNQQRATRRPRTATRNRHLVVAMELADKQHGVEQRANIEEDFTEGTLIEAQITVQGWFKDNNKSEELWRAGEYYVIDSPSLILNGVTMGCRECVYEQTNAGTTTTLTMVRPRDIMGRLATELNALDQKFDRESKQQAPSS